MKKFLSLRILLFSLVILSAIFYFLYTLRGYGVESIPCTYFSEYSVGDYIDDNLSNINDNFIFDESLTFDSSSYDELLQFEMRDNRNINSMKGLGKLENKNDIEGIDINHTCISSIQGLDEMSSLKAVDLSYNNIETTQGVENLEELEVLLLRWNPIETIENIEDIRSDTSHELLIQIDDDNLKYITQESYEYIINPENNVRLLLTPEPGGIIRVDNDMDEIEKKYLSEKVEIISDEAEKSRNSN